MARTRSFSRARLLTAGVALAMPLALLAALPSASIAVAADPTSPIKNGGNFTAVDEPAFPAAFVADSGGGHYSALTEAGTTVLEYDEDAAAPPVATKDLPALYKMWADDEPYPTAGADDTGSGAKHGLDQALFLAAGDIDGAVDWTGPSGVELAWISGTGASTTLSLSNTQASGFTFRTSTAIEAGPIGLTMVEKDPGTNDLGALLVAYPGKIVAHVLDGSTLRAGVTMQLPAGMNGTILDVYHKPMHEVNPGEITTPFPRMFAIALRANGTVATHILAARLSATEASAVIANAQVTRAPLGTWTEADVVYDSMFATSQTVAMLSVRGTLDGKTTVSNEVAIDPARSPEPEDCAGSALAGIDIEVVGAEVYWVCSVVNTGGGLVMLRQTMGGNAITTQTVTSSGFAGFTMTSPQPQIDSPCAYLLRSLKAPLPNGAECSAGEVVDADKPQDRFVRYHSFGRPSIKTFVSAGPDASSLSGYLVVANKESFGRQTEFTMPAVEGAGTSALPILSVPLPAVPTKLEVHVPPQAPELVQSDPVPVAFLAAPPHVAGAGQDADPPEFASTSGSGSSNGTSTASHFGVSLGVAYEDPLGAFAVGLQASVEHSVETGVESEVEIESSEEFRGLLDKNVVVYNALQMHRYKADVLRSSTGLAVSQDQIDFDLPLSDEAVMSAASVENLVERFPKAFGANGHLTPAINEIFEKSTPGDPGGYMNWGTNGQAVENYCVGSLDGSSGDREFGVTPQVPDNDFNDLDFDRPPKPDIHHSNKHQVLVGTGNSEGATFGIERSTTRSRVETTTLDVSATVRAAYVEASVNGGASWTESWSNTLSQGVGFASFVGHVPETNEFLKKESYNWRSFLCQVKATGKGGLPVTGWVLNYTVDDYNGSGGLEELSDLDLISPKGSIEVSDPRPDLTFEQESGTVHTYDWELQAVNVNDVHSGTISYATPKESNQQRQTRNTVAPTDDLKPGQLYRWRVKATDFFGNTELSDWEFFRTPSPASAPQAVITVSPTTVNAGETVSFENDTVPGAMAPIYTWNFGDGTTVTTADATVPHVFTMAGIYAVTLTAVTAAGTTTDTVEIRVLPRLTADTYRTDEDTALNATNGVLANDAGVSTAVLVQGTNNGALDLKPDGTFTYTPKADFCGADAFTYSAGAVNQVATITVACVNDAPKAVDDAYSLREDGQQTVDLGANDSDVDGDTLTLTAGSPAHGTVTKEPDGRFTYKPAADWCGTDEFAVTVSDGKGGSSTAKARAHVECVNDLPVAGDDTYRMDEDTQQTVNLLANDTDVDGDALLITSGSARNGTVTPGANGAVTYKPERDWCGTDEFVSTVTDGKGGIDTSVARVTVVCINDGPVGSDDEVTLDEDGTITVNPVGNDPDGDTLTVTVSDPDHGTVTEDDRGHLVYHPDPDYCGPDSFTVTLSDGKGGTSTMTVRVTVECSNDAPTGVDDSVSTKEDKRLTLDPTKNDTDPDGAGGALTVQLGADPDHGDVRLLLSGKVSYVPRADFCGTDRFTYRPVDDEGAAGVRATTVTIDVQCVNDRPKAARDEFSRRLPKSGKRIVKVPVPGVLRNDTDVDSKLKAVLVRGSDQGKVRLRANGSFTIRVPNGKDAPRWIAFTYRACDDQQCSRNRRAVVQLR